MFVFTVGIVGDDALAAPIAKAGFDVVTRTAGGDWDAFGAVDLAIEAVAEELEAKQEVLAELDARTPGHAILASATQLQSITELGDATQRPDQVVGMHFVAGTRLVEIVEGEDTSSATAQAAANFAQALRRQPVRCAESPGFIVNRIVLAASAEPREQSTLRDHLVETYGDRFAS